MPSYRLACLWLVLPLLLAGAAPAFATDATPITTRPIGSAPSPMPTAEPGALPEAGGPQAVEAAAPKDGKIHGMVSVGVGTNGYREGALALQGALPNGGTVAIAVDSAQINSGRAHRDREPAQPSAN